MAAEVISDQDRRIASIGQHFPLPPLLNAANVPVLCSVPALGSHQLSLIGWWDGADADSGRIFEPFSSDWASSAPADSPMIAIDRRFLRRIRPKYSELNRKTPQIGR